ncbi:MAG: DUF4389 domain-containing protein [Chloroflexi bacterium]|nr:DUF4389 domain-containing protein [Chloroflexota bacterium]
MASDASSSGSGGWGSGSPGGTPGWGDPQRPGQAPQGGWPAASSQGGWSQQPGQAPQGTQGWAQQPTQSGWGQQPGQASQGTQGWGQQQPGQAPQGTQGWGQQQPTQSGWGQQQPGQAPQGTQGWPQQPGQAPQGAQGWGQQSGWGQTPGQQSGWGTPPAGNQWAPTLPTGGWDTPEPWADAGYPVDVRYTPEGRIGRYWGIPIIGHMVRGLCLIPHAIALMLLGIVAYLVIFVSWIPVLINGRQAGWIHSVLGGYVRWWVRTVSWAWLLSGTYPPFSVGDDPNQHVRVRIDRDQPISRIWGIPIIGVLLRSILLIPHFIVLMVLWFVSYIVLIFAWIPVLIYGRQADAVYTLVGGTLRWTARVQAYMLLVSGPYPPFRLD